MYSTCIYFLAKSGELMSPPNHPQTLLNRIFIFLFQSLENLMSSDAESTTGEKAAAAAAAGAAGGVVGGETTAAGVAASTAAVGGAGVGGAEASLKEPEVLTSQQVDDYLHRHEQGEQEGRGREGKQ